MKQALKESLEKGAGSYEQIKSVARAYSSKRECSLHEPVYQVMPELWLRKVFPGVLHTNFLRQTIPLLTHIQMC